MHYHLVVDVHLDRFYCKVISVCSLLLLEKPLEEVCLKFFVRIIGDWEHESPILWRRVIFDPLENTKLLMLNKHGDHFKLLSVQIFTRV